MTLVKQRARGILLSDTFAFTGTVSGAGGGKVVQIAHSTLSPATNSTGGNSFVTAGHKVDITPTSASNRILIMLNGGTGYIASNDTRMHTALYRDISGGSGATNITNANEGFATHYMGSSNTAAPHSGCVVDTSYNTTSAIEYKLYYRNHNNSGTVYQNVSWAGNWSLVAIEYQT